MSERIDLNTAPAETLATLPGIGEALAQRIVEYRTEKGPFPDVDALTAVPGISENVVEDLSSQVMLSLPESMTAAVWPVEAEDEAAEAAVADEAAAAPVPAATPPETTGREAAEATPEFERRAVRRGCFSIIFGAVLGALVGTALTLSILSWLNNGSLTYNEAAVGLRNQLDDEIATRQSELEGQATLASVLATRQGALVFTQNQATTRQAAVEATQVQSLEDVAAALATSQANGEVMRVTAVYLETRIADAGNAADTLNAFLGGLDDLLTDVGAALPEAAAAEATPTATPSQTMTGQSTAATSPTPTDNPTRTRRPTATPLAPIAGTVTAAASVTPAPTP